MNNHHPHNDFKISPGHDTPGTLNSLRELFALYDSRQPFELHTIYHPCHVQRWNGEIERFDKEGDALAQWIVMEASIEQVTLFSQDFSDKSPVTICLRTGEPNTWTVCNAMVRTPVISYDRLRRIENKYAPLPRYMIQLVIEQELAVMV